MAFWDNQDFDIGGDSYKPMQSNVLGQSLAPVNQQGQLSAVDATNDTRTPEQFKLDAQQANKIASNSPDEDENYITSQGGNKYEKVNNSKWDQSLTAAATYMSAYFASNGDVGKAAQATGQALYNNDAKEHRLKQVDQLEQAGMNPLDIQNWINSGDKKDLVTNKGSWTSGGNGTMFNTLTGETRQIQGAVNNNVPVKTENLGDRVIEYYADGTTKERTRGVSPDKTFTAAGATGGGIGLDEDEANANGGFVFENGQWVQHTTYANGRPKTVVANATQQKALNEQQAAGTPDASQTMMSSDINTLQNAVNNKQTGTFTGQIVGRSGLAQDLLSSTVGTQGERDAQQAASRINGYMQNQGVGAAKSMGLTGINTIEEAKRAFASMPQLDYTSPEALNASLQNVSTYVQNYNSKAAANKGTTQQPAAPKGVTHVQRNPQTGKLEIVGG
ncbi:TPA: hypothetical protein SI878_004410 [Salmonella enterica]|nr:hypothetical protein [Salmonella enterica]